MMKLYYKLYPYFKNPGKIFQRSALKKLLAKKDSYSEKEYIEKKFKIDLGYKLNLEAPKTFNEKMQWLKFYNQQSIFTEMAGKHTVKKYVSEKIGKEYIAKEFGCWDHFDEIDFASLPNAFVLKTTHGCGSMFICKDKNKYESFGFLKEKFEESLNFRYYDNYYEWPYRDIKPQIIAEELLDDGNNRILPVYKFFCFNGEPLIAQIIQNDKQDNETIDYIDMDFNFLKLSQGYPNSKKKNRLNRPKLFENMKEIARKLSEGIPFIRVDLYDLGEKIVFSEFTFFSDAGFAKFFPKKWDYELGEKIKLPSHKIIENKKYDC